MPDQQLMSKITKMQLKKAKSLIEINNLNEARQLLITIDHPTAERWLQELDKHQGKSVKRKPQKKWSITKIVAYGIGLPVLICGFLSTLWYTPEESVDQHIRRAINENVEGAIFNARFQNDVVIASYFTDETVIRRMENEIGNIACDLKTADIPADEYNITAWQDEYTWLVTALITPEEMQNLDCSDDADRIGRQIEDFETQ